MTHTLQNQYWQAEILPEHGASVAAGRVRYSGNWVDIIRPTPPGGSPGSFLMLPWPNRIREGRFTFEGETYQLRTTKDDGTARHGDVRKRLWKVVSEDERHATYRFQSIDHTDFNFPFALDAELTYALEDADFVWQLSLTSRDDRPFPYGFGYHPYFTRHSPTMPSLTLPVSQEYTLVDALPDGPPSPLSDSVDFRQRRPVPDDAGFDHLFGGLDVAEPICLRYEQWHLEVQMHVDDVFTHAVLFSAPDGTLAVEPQTCATDAFNLAARGVEGTGMQVLSAGESVSAAVRLRVTAI